MPLLWLLFLLIMTTTILGQPTSNPPSYSDFYFRCPAIPTTGSEVFAVMVRSQLECHALCSSTNWCGSVVVHADVGSDRIQCMLRNDSPLSQCPEGSDVEYQTAPYFVRQADAQEVVSTTAAAKESSTSEPDILTSGDESMKMTITTTEETIETTESPCQNGGVLEQGVCVCPLPFAGITCGRYIRDCSEAFDMGYEHNYIEVFLIQPISAPSPFLVQCRLQWGGVTYIMRRKVAKSREPWANITWHQAKTGFGEDLSVVHDSKYFFMGLEKMYQILSQAEYRADFESVYNNSNAITQAYYTNITMGPDSRDYEISYTEFGTNEKIADNGLDGQLPKKFSTHDHDGSGCGLWGWYASDCTGFALLRDPPLWPVAGSQIELDIVKLNIRRKSPYHDQP